MFMISMLTCYYVQIHDLITDTSQHKLLLLTGRSLEDTGDLIFHNGHFSPNHFIQIFTDDEVCDKHCGGVDFLSFVETHQSVK